MNKRLIRSDPQVAARLQVLYPPAALAVVALLRFAFSTDSLVTMALALLASALAPLSWATYRVDGATPLYPLLVALSLSNALATSVFALASARAPTALGAALAVGLATALTGHAAIHVVGRLSARWREFIQPGQCQRCGYDLRGSPGPRCPECGETT